jgi:peptidoglycan hydrolase-like protein with peptidoglycan-binding domain
VAGEPTLRFGHINVNGWVAHLQERLAGVGFDPGPIDGMFFERTHAAVLGFQESRALVVDGVVGQQTWGALNAAAPAVPPASSPPAGGGGGPVGSGVRFLQGPDFDEPSGGIFYVAENAGPTARAAFSVHDTITVSGPDGSVLFEQDFFNGDELAAGGSYGNQSIKVHNDQPGPHQVFVMLDEGRGENVSFEFTIGGPVGLSIEFVQGPDLNRPTGGVFYAAENHGTGTAAPGEIEDRVVVVGPDGSTTLDQFFFNEGEVGPQGNYGNESGPAHDGTPGTYVGTVTLDSGRGDSRTFSFDIGSDETAPSDVDVPIDIDVDKVRGFFELP